MLFSLSKNSVNMEEEEIIINGEYDDTTEAVFSSTSFSDYIYAQLKSHQKKIFQIDGITGKTQNFEELHNESMVLAASLQRLGILSGETVSVISENRLELSPVILACLFSGSVFAPVNPTYSIDEIVHVLSISKPRILFCSLYTYKNVSIALGRLKGICHVILFDETPDVPIQKYRSLLRCNPIIKLYQCRDDEIAAILTSSGTTGLPKGVMLSYSNMKFFCKLSMSRKFLNFKPEDIILGLLPLFHGYGYGLLLSSIMLGLKFVLLPKFEENLFLSTIAKYRVTHLCLVPPLMVFLGKHPLVTKYNLSCVTTILCGAAPLSSEVAVLVKKRLPHAEIRQGYGMTESSIALSIAPPHSNKPESVGKLASGLQVMVVDIETGKPLKRGQQGEILVRGPCVMAGYCGDPEATRQTIDTEGWLHTGDIGFVDKQGFFYIVDRKKELIKYKGFQVPPAELESLILAIPGVKDVAVIGLPDLVAGELPIAYVVLQPKSNLTDSSIINYVRERVSPHKRLHSVRFVESVPRNPSGKILRRLLRNLNSKL